MGLRDRNGRRLENGFYVSLDPTSGNAEVYRIVVAPDEKSFSAEYWDGFLNITDPKCAAENFLKLENPPGNLRFLEQALRGK